MSTHKTIRALKRNDPCWCGSDKKYKKCHMRKDEELEHKAQDEYEYPVWALAQMRSDQLKAELPSLDNQAILARIKKLGATRTEQLDELLADESLVYVSAVDIYSELEGFESLEGPKDVPHWGMMEEQQLITLIEEYARRNYPNIPHHLDLYTRLGVLSDRLNEDPPATERRELTARIVTLMLDTLDPAKGELPAQIEDWEMSFEADAMYYVTALLDEAQNPAFLRAHADLIERIHATFRAYPPFAQRLAQMESE
jgi:hypothetical protein